MAKRVIQLYDKYKSTTKVYPLIVGECLTDDAKLAIKGIADKEIEDNVPDIEANVTLSGDEATLESLKIGDTTYKVGGGKNLFIHSIKVITIGGLQTFSIYVLNDSNATFTLSSLNAYLASIGCNNSNNICGIVSGYGATSQGKKYIPSGIYYSGTNVLVYGGLLEGGDTSETINSISSDKVIPL